MRGAADHTVDFGEMRAMRLDTHQQQLHKNQHDDYRRADHQVVGVEIVECGDSSSLAMRYTMKGMPANSTDTIWASTTFS